MHIQQTKQPKPQRRGLRRIQRLAGWMAPLLLTACTVTGHEQVVTEKTEFITVDTGCTWTRAIYVSPADVFTEETGKAILSHNLSGEKRCGWKKSRK